VGEEACEAKCGCAASPVRLGEGTRDVEGVLAGVGPALLHRSAGGTQPYGLVGSLPAALAGGASCSVEADAGGLGTVPGMLLE
jgi:hypothetical protein